MCKAPSFPTSATKPRSKSKPRPQSATTWPIREIIARLEPAYGPAQTPRGYDATSELIYTILSQNTSDTNSTRAYSSLRASFESWEAMATAEPQAVVDAIRIGGLAQIKGPRIQAILRELKARNGTYDISFLAEMPLDEAKAWLRELPGVGPKTVGCVLMFALGRPALPVDTHVHRVSIRLGLIGPKVTADQSHDALEALVAPDDRLPFHLYLIRHGRVVCKAQRPLCGDCLLEERCPSSLRKTSASSLKPAPSRR